MPKVLVAPTINQQIRSLSRTAETLDLTIEGMKLAADFILCELEPDTPLYSIETQHHTSGYTYASDILKRLKALRASAFLEIQRLTREEKELADAKRKSGIDAKAALTPKEATPPPNEPGPLPNGYINHGGTLSFVGNGMEVDCGNS